MALAPAVVRRGVLDNNLAIATTYEGADMRKAPMAIRHILALTTLLAAAGCGLNGPAHDAPLPDAAAVVDLGFMSFNPETINIKAGQSVEWRNTSIITHTVTDNPATAAKAGDSILPAGAIPFSSGDIDAGKIFVYRFTVPGTYRYFCMHHEGDGMVGTIVVAPAS
jgi:plastocyanin